MLLDDDRMNSVISRILSGLDNYECQSNLREDRTWDTISILSDLSVGTTNLRPVPPSKGVPERYYYNESFDWMKRHQPEQLTSLCRLSTTSYYLRSRDHEFSEYERDKMFMKDAFLPPESSPKSFLSRGPTKSKSISSSNSAAASFVTRSRRDFESEDEASSELDIELTFSDSFVRQNPSSSSSFTSSSAFYDASYSTRFSGSGASRDDSTALTSVSWKGDSSTFASAPRCRGHVGDGESNNPPPPPPPPGHCFWFLQGMIQTCIEDECAIFADNNVAIEIEEELAVPFRYDGDSWSLWSSDSSSQGSF